MIADVDNELLRDADDYLRKHKVLELFEDLTTILSYKQPENMEEFLVDILKQRKEQGSRSIVYNEAELQNIFTLYDLKGSSHISKDQCKEALKTLANSEYHFTQAQEANIPEKVDLFTFMKLCDEVLGIKPR
eukprot:CAMPEP_0170556208 /NCGR_PEP_ID=MMETSP0211-20121228/15769_1 /TAXON_ID=311385 /ORGANISM="Pseudokeronopsis sp., Strain OXSARD2" /LENGTH=131 /DNA_ID=CAMNT_0010866395 /DNA_START=21 /DNA_END=416 /DNA_ORIENTATION=-